MLSDNFHHLTISPSNASQLRAFVLQLAVQGKLTASWRAQVPNIENGHSLLDRIMQEKEQLIKRGIMKREKPLRPLSPEEIAFELPEAWIWTRFGELGDWGAGATPSRGNSLFYDGQINWFKSGELNNGIMDYPSEEKITELAMKKVSLRLNKPGDVLIAMYGATIGKTGLLKVDGTTNQAVCACTPLAGISSEFLLLLLNAFKTVFINQGAGGAQPNISREKIRNTPVPLVSSNEQVEILFRVTQLMKSIDELESEAKNRIELKNKFVIGSLFHFTNLPNVEATDISWSLIKNNFYSFFDEVASIKLLRRAILQLVVRGKLTQGWRRKNRGIESAGVLLEKLREEKAKLITRDKIKKDDLLPPIKAADVPYELPEGWIWCRLQEVGLLNRGKSKHRPRNDPKLFTDGKYPLVQTGDISSAKYNGGLVTTHNSEYNEFGLSQSMMWEKGTLCITIAANIAETGFLGYDACFPDSIVGFTSLSGENTSKYVQYFIEVTKSDLERYAPSTAQKNINLGILNGLIFPLPPLLEQEQIVAKVKMIMQECDRLEGDVIQLEQEADQLMRAILREALKENESVNQPVIDPIHEM